MEKPPGSGVVIRIVLAEDNADLRMVLRLTLDGEPDLKCVGETGSLEGLPEQIAGNQADVVVLDLHLNDGPVFGELKALCEQFPDVRFIVHSGDGSPPLVRKALDAGAAGYVTKGDDVERLLATIRGVPSA